VHIFRLAARAPCRSGPVTSTLARRARRHSNGPATSNQGAQLQTQSWPLHATNRALRSRPQSTGRHPRSAAVPRSFDSTGPVCDATNRPVSQGRFAPPCCAGQSVPGLRRQEAAHLRHRWSPCHPLVCQHLKTGLQPQHLAKHNLRRALVAQPRWRYKAIMATTSAHRLRSNWSFNRTANGVPPWPRGSVVHHLPRGQGATPSSAG
jgi:hypothetical protein